MHQIIYAVVTGTDKEDALGRGKHVFDTLTRPRHNSAVFDYYTAFDEDGNSVSGEDRWGEHPAVVPLDSATGTEWVEDGIKSTRNQLSDALDTVAAGMTDSEADDTDPSFLTQFSDLVKSIFSPLSPSENGNTGSPFTGDIDITRNFQFRYACLKIGRDRGLPYRVYDQNGDSIASLDKLEHIRSSEADSDTNLWVVPADVHI